MEESINPTANSAFRPKDGSASSEESGWTMYFEDFMASEERKAAGGFSFGVVSGSSMISDAASCVAWKPSSASLQVSENYRKLSLKKRKGLLHDDSLEDTASSPVNSPKVTTTTTSFRLILYSLSCRDSLVSVTLNDVGNRNGLELNQTLNGFDFVEKTDECRELKKRGLCLVPLSMLVDYLG
ncbi:unnamed protein product [Musa hybrid cultivar]